MTLSLCTTVVGRWDKLDNCLTAVSNGTKQPDEIIVLDNSNNPGTDPVLDSHPVSVIPVDEQIGPSAARNRLSREADNDRILFIDADVKPKPRSIERLYTQLDESDYQAAAGIWTDFEEYYRRVANSMTFDHEGGKVLKQPISYRDVQDFSTIEVEFSTPQLMIERDLLESVQFDPDYRFLYEWWDFFMQLRKQNQPILCNLNAEFVHEPGGYDGDESTRHNGYDGSEDKAYFIKKWGYEPVNTAFDDGTFNPSLINRSLSYLSGLFDMAQKRKL